MVNNIESTVVTTRIRLARNLADYPFPSALQSVKQAKEIVRAVYDAASSVRPFKLYYMGDISDNVAQALCDDHLISTELAANKKYGAAVLDEGEEEDGQGQFSLMVNEEDHLREQYIAGGLCLQRAYNALSVLDGQLSRRLRFAFDAQLGYLTACPTNLGTGLRASVMLFLPALTRLRKMGQVIREISRLGHTVRGVYGEGSAAEGFLYQLSNEVTLGVSEEYILTEVQHAALEVVNLESQARKALREEDEIGIKDECMRSYGILANCAKIAYTEFLQRISDVKLGAALGFLAVTDFSALNALVAAARPANVGLYSDKKLTAPERDVLRADLCRRSLAKLMRGESRG